MVKVKQIEVKMRNRWILLSLKTRRNDETVIVYTLFLRHRQLNEMTENKIIVLIAIITENKPWNCNEENKDKNPENENKKKSWNSSRH